MRSGRGHGLRIGLAMVLPFCLCTSAAATEACVRYPYADGSGALSDLALMLRSTLSSHPSLEKALENQAPDLCLSDELVTEQGYFEPKSNRIVLNTGLGVNMQMAILFHEIRHLEQFDRDTCPTVSVTLSDYMRSRLAMEADASAVGVYVAWKMSEDGNSGPWEALQTWPTHVDLVARFAEVISLEQDEVRAAEATYAQWFESEERRSVYAFAICSNYLDALDLDHVDPGKSRLPDDYAARLCVLPDGRPYHCALPQ